jgi:Tfp pilus assembly protein FimT
VREKQRGYSSAEMLTVVAIIGMFLLVTLPAFGNINRRRALRVATLELRSVFAVARSRAVATGRNVGLKFTSLAGTWHFAVYADGDGDGVRNDDINKGVDRRLSRPRPVFPASSAVKIGLLSHAVRDPDGDPLPPSKGPVAFNRTTICSFSPLGEATAGSIYITDRRELWCVRVHGAGTLRVARYDAAKKRWLP